MKAVKVETDDVVAKVPGRSSIELKAVQRDFNRYAEPILSDLGEIPMTSPLAGEHLCHNNLKRKSGSNRARSLLYDKETGNIVLITVIEKESV